MLSCDPQRQHETFCIMRAAGPPLKFKAIRKRVCEELDMDFPKYACEMLCRGDDL